VARPGTSNHEAGYAFDVPQRFRTAKVVSILKKWGCVKIPGDPPHFEWKNAPTGKKRIELNAKMNAWFRKCVKGMEELASQIRKLTI